LLSRFRVTTCAATARGLFHITVHVVLVEYTIIINSTFNIIIFGFLPSKLTMAERLAAMNEPSRPSDEASAEDAATNSLGVLQQQLEEVLGIVNDSQKACCVEFVAWLGCASLVELAVFAEEDLRAHFDKYENLPFTNTIPPISQTKLLKAAGHLRKGASLDDLVGMFGPSRNKSEANKMIHLQVGEDRFTTKKSTLCRVSVFKWKGCIQEHLSHVFVLFPGGRFLF